MADNVFATLTADELADLKLCGITTEEQLQHSTPGAVRRDLEQAQSFFPSHKIVLTEERLAAICGQEDEDNDKPEETPDIPGLHEGQRGLPTVQFRRKKNLREEILRQREQKEEERQRRNSELSTIAKLEHMHGLSKHFHAVRCSHPHRVFFGAWATLLLIVPFFGLLLLPFMLLTGNIDQMKPMMFGAIFIATVLPWFLIARTAECGVCHMRLFSFKHYSHHREAHHLPFIGYTIATALHIIMLFWFRCPACGTQMKLFGSGRRHRH